MAKLTLFNYAMHSWRVLPFDIFIHGEQTIIYYALRDIKKNGKITLAEKIFHCNNREINDNKMLIYLESSAFVDN